MSLSRRDVLKAGLGLALVSQLPSPAMAALDLTPYHANSSGTKLLSFYQTHTAEAVTAKLMSGGQIDAEGLKKINHILRDHRTGDMTEMDPQLLSWLHDLREHFGTDAPLHIISAYRSEKTNAMLAGRSSGVAKKSMHMLGKAIDIRIPGIKTKAIRDIALDMQRGGVGFYAASDFVHLDTGRVRFW